MHVGCSVMNEQADCFTGCTSSVTDEQATLTSGSTDVMNRNISGTAGHTGNL